MKKITSAYANKWLKSLEEDKEYWVNKEEASSTYEMCIRDRYTRTAEPKVVMHI